MCIPKQENGEYVGMGTLVCTKDDSGKVSEVKKVGYFKTQKVIEI